MEARAKVHHPQNKQNIAGLDRSAAAAVTDASINPQQSCVAAMKFWSFALAACCHLSLVGGGRGHEILELCPDYELPRVAAMKFWSFALTMSCRVSLAGGGIKRYRKKMAPLCVCICIYIYILRMCRLD